MKGRLGFRGEGGEGKLSKKVMAMTSTPAVQKLYDVCKKVFTPASVPLEAQVAKVRAVLGTFATFSLRE